MQKKQKDSTVPESVCHAEDLAQKAAAQLFGQDILAWLGIREKVKQVAPTEITRINLRHMYEDFNYIMENGQWYHFEFESG